MGVLKRKDIAPGAAKVALTGQRCTEWPPLQVDPNTGVPTMEDRDTLGAQIEQQGAFQNYFITWPGSRLQIDDLREVSWGGKGTTYTYVARLVAVEDGDAVQCQSLYLGKRVSCAIRPRGAPPLALLGFRA